VLEIQDIMKKQNDRPTLTWWLKILVIWIILISGFFFTKVKGQTKDSVRAYLEFIECKEVDIVLAQAILETGHFKSYSSRVRHNLFGLTRNHKLEAFDTWQESCDKYLLWIQYKYDGRESYYNFLLRIGYASDSIYIKKLKKISI